MTYPIVLAHGIARFDVLARELVDDGAAAEDATHYFRGIRSTLRNAGFRAHHSNVPWAESVSNRAEALKSNVECIRRREDCSKVHVIAHSMGGLDARHMLFEHQRDRMHEKVASVTTIGTPHLGTSFADWGVEHASELLAMLEVFEIDKLDGFRDLTTKACLTFDEDARDFERSCGVLFQTFAGTQALPYVFAPLQLPWFIITEADRRFDGGANDGLVPLYSQKWRDEYFRRRFDADHLNEIGWWDSNELGLRFFPSAQKVLSSIKQLEKQIRGLYLEIARELAERFPDE